MNKVYSLILNKHVCLLIRRCCRPWQIIICHDINVYVTYADLVRRCLRFWMGHGCSQF